ncbi:MAG: hypothetical protein CUR32_01145 [Flavobacterium sp.]|nr:MAG: hypothetical protein CUR32_01145 [Flavobacterium sp.] [Flavobacterium sp. FEMGT703F]
MTIKIEKFDRAIYDTEKCSFLICCFSSTYNVSEGTCNWYEDDELRQSPVWRNWRSIKQQRQEFWAEIKKYLPHYLETGMKEINSRRYSGSYYFYSLIHMAEKLLDTGKLKLIYISDKEHAEMIGRCVQYLANEIRPF